MEVHRDVNAARNVLKRAVAGPWSGFAQGNNGLTGRPSLRKPQARSSLPNSGKDFELRHYKISVSGGQWNTIVVIEWEETNSGTDGVRTYNHGIHVMQLRWGRATRLLICPDTIGLRVTLDRVAAAGNTEALAAPIVD